MNKKSRKAAVPLESQFAEVATIVHRGRVRAVSAIGMVVIDTYWQIGEYISRKVTSAEWGEGVVMQLADYLQRTLADPKGLSDKNLWRMKQFFDLYRGYEKLSALLRELHTSAESIFRDSILSISSASLTTTLKPICAKASSDRLRISLLNSAGISRSSGKSTGYKSA